MKMRAVLITLMTMLRVAALGGRTLVPIPQQEHADQTTQVARGLVLERIDAIAQNGQCRQTFGQEKINLDLLRLTVQQTRFYDATGFDGNLKFSAVVGKPASPDQTLRTLALQVGADAFVLGYFDTDRYLRTKHVVLSRGYFEQADPHEGALRPTTREEKQSLLLHEILHIALGKDDDDLNSRALCPLRLLAFCPRSQTASGRPRFRPDLIEARDARVAEGVTRLRPGARSATRRPCPARHTSASAATVAD
jgi:hypothetical protein